MAVYIWIPILCQVTIMSFFYEEVYAQIIESPSDVAGRVGENVNISCRVSPDNTQPFQWTEFVTRADGSSSVLYSDPPTGNNPLDTSKYTIFGKYDLQVKDVQLVDAGAYSCQVFGGDAQTYYMIVFEHLTVSTPEMTEGLSYNLTCETRFNASDPDRHMVAMEFEVNGEQRSGTTTLTEKTDTVPYILRGYAPYTAQAKDSGANFVCRVSTSFPVGYSITGETTLNVQFGVRDLTITDNNSPYAEGETIICSATGNPTPTYKWEAITSRGGLTKIDGPVLVIRNHMANDLNDINDVNVWKCTATNTISTISGNITFTVNSTTLSIETTPNIATTTIASGNSKECSVCVCDSSWLPAVIVLAILLVLSLILLVVIFLKYKSLKTKSSTNPFYQPEVYLTTNVDNNRVSYENIGAVQSSAPEQTTRTYESVDLNDVRPVGESTYTDIHTYSRP